MVRKKVLIVLKKELNYLKNKSLMDIRGNAAQIQAITHVNGPAMVLAGPGSGKTFVIIHRIRHLIEVAGVDPSSILVITFTKSAAIEMQQRFLKLTDSNYPEVHFGTFHSVFYQMIRMSGKQKQIITENGKVKLLERVLEGLVEETKNNNQYRNIKVPDNNERAMGSGNRNIEQKIDFDDEITVENIKILLSEIGRLKNSGLSAENHSDNIPFKEIFVEIYNAYNKMLRELDKIDFDDMILDCYQMLMDSEAICKKWQGVFKYILIDETQDINEMQMRIIQKLSPPENNIFIVGDDDQSIYRFRGSKPEFMLEFDKYYPDVTKIFLNVNYRCQRRIVETSLKVINENKIRFDKDIQAGNTDSGGKVVLRSYHSRDEQYRDIASFLGRNPDKWDDCAIIFRTNTEATALAGYLKEYEIDIVSKGASKSFYDKYYILDVLAYLDFASGGGKRSDYFRIMNKPLRYFSRDSAPSEIVTIRSLSSFYKGKPYMLRAVDKFYREINMVGNMRPALAIRYIRRVIGYEEFILEDKRDADRKTIIDDLDYFERLAHEFQDYKSFREEVARCLKAERDEQQMKASGKGRGVKLMTMHASKGLEFDTVWLPDLNEGIVPGRRSVSAEEIEEERRMFYVGITRAKNNLIMSYVAGTEENPMMASRFLRRLKDEKGG